jgi:hypothetical protein
MLTTITPYWQRPDMLRVWFRAVKGATQPGMKHIVFFVGEPVPDWLAKEAQFDPAFHLVPRLEDTPGDLSIGHYHNLGAQLACSPWIMKLDVDTLPNVRYFQELLPMLEKARPAEWFNGGMVYVREEFTSKHLTADKMPLLEETYLKVMGNLRSYCGGPGSGGPAATNFICRRTEYLRLGGCDERFRGYGWEDYQQIYMLEHNFLGAKPLGGVVTFDNVTRRCCHEISRPKARELWHRNKWLVLLHRFHLSSPNNKYKSHEGMRRNRAVLLEYITKRKSLCLTRLPQSIC